MFIISVKWLKENLDNEKLIILDTSIKPVVDKTSGQEENEEVIPNSRKFDLNNVFSDKSNSLPHTLPKRSEFIKGMQELGISNDSIIVLYDNRGIYSSPRVLFMIRELGHKQVYLLDGGLIEWKRKGNEIVSYDRKFYIQGDFGERFKETFFCDIKKVLNSFLKSSYRIIDARSQNRFYGLENEPRDNVKLGHIPNAINIPFASVLHNNKYKTKEELIIMFRKLVENDAKIILYCGSGVTSCILALALELADYKHFKIYDGSWSEWANMNTQNPIHNT